MPLQLEKFFYFNTKFHLTAQLYKLILTIHICAYLVFNHTNKSIKTLNCMVKYLRIS